MKTILIFQPRRLRWVRYPRCPPACSLHSSPSSVLAPTWWNSSLAAPQWQGWLQPSLTSPAVPPISSEPPTPRRVVSRPRGDRGDQHTLQSSPTTGPCTAATTPNRPRPWSLTIPLPGKPSSIISDTLAKYVFICDTISLNSDDLPFLNWVQTFVEANCLNPSLSITPSKLSSFNFQSYNH